MLRSLHSGAYRCAILTPVRLKKGTQRTMAAAATDAPERKQLMSVAPMMEWTDVHYRQMARMVSKHVWLWTEMVVDKTIIYTDNLDRHLWFPPEQHPIVLQVGGSDPETLRKAALKIAPYGYDEVNLNCGCPSDRVAGAGCFGASMMLRPDNVAACMQALHEGLGGNTPVTVKCRIGVDAVDDYASLCDFVSAVSASSPCTHFIVHSRKCLLKGLNPSQNRTVPPLRYAWVFALRRDFPHLEFSLNGGIQSLEEVRDVLAHREGDAGVHGVMVGRAAYHTPWQALAQADTLVFGAEVDVAKNRRQVIEEYSKYADAMFGRWHVKADGHQSPNARALIKPFLNMFHGAKGCKKWKSTVDGILLRKPATVSEVFAESLHCLSDADLDAAPGGITDSNGRLKEVPKFTAVATGVWPPVEMPPPFGLARKVPAAQAAAAAKAEAETGDSAPCAAAAAEGAVAEAVPVHAVVASTEAMPVPVDVPAPMDVDAVADPVAVACDDVSPNTPELLTPEVARTVDAVTC